MKWILAGALLMAVPLVAGAECGWILWEELKIATYKEPFPTPSYTLQSAHPTFQRCDAKARELALQRQASPSNRLMFHAEGRFIDATEGFYKILFEPELPTPGDFKAVEEWKAQGRAIHGVEILQCLPDSINPAVERKREEDVERKRKKDAMKKH